MVFEPAGNRRFLWSGRPRRPPKNHSRRWGAKPPTFWNGFWGRPKIGDLWPAQKPCIKNPSVTLSPHLGAGACPFDHWVGCANKLFSRIKLNIGRRGAGRPSDLTVRLTIVPCVTQWCFRAGNRASGPDVGRILFGKTSKSALRPAFGRPDCRLCGFPG